MKVVDEKNSLLQGFLRWRERHIKDKQFVLILSFLVGICTALAACLLKFLALAACLLKFLVEYIKEFLTENFDSTGVNWLYLVYPVVGIFFYRSKLVVLGISGGRYLPDRIVHSKSGA